MGERTFLLPDLGEGLEDAEIARWLVAEGDEVKLNQPLLEADTAKALVEIPSPVEGKVTKLHAAEGDTVQVGKPLVTFESDDDVAGSSRKAVLVGYGVEEGEKPKRRRRIGAATKDAFHEEPGGPKAAPPVRKLAKEMGIDLSSVNGSGPGGRITREDVLGASDTSSSDANTVPIRGIRKLVAAKMSRSAREIPHVTTFLDADFTAINEARAAGGGVSVLAYVAAALTKICGKHPKLNSSWDEDAGVIVLHPHCHMGVATDTSEGLVVPVIRHAQDKGVAEIASEISRLAEAVRSRKASPAEVTSSTITISNVGSFGAAYGTPIINHPEAAILALGVVEERAVVRDSKIVIRPMGTLSLSFDHRILDGAEAGRALQDLKGLLEDPEALKEI